MVVIIVNEGGESLRPDVNITVHGIDDDNVTDSIYRGIRALLLEFGPHPKEGYDVKVFVT